MRLFGNCFNKILDMGPKKKVILLFLILLVFFSFMFKFYGYNKTWRLWNVPTCEVTFADFRCITDGAIAFRNGFDPMVENPFHPEHSLLNYPRIWQTLYLFGIDIESTNTIGIALSFIFLISIFLILSKANNKIIGLVFLAVLSPAVLLGIERGNIDLFIFFLTVLSVLAIQKSYNLFVFFILMGIVLKLFPFFTILVLLRGKKKEFVSYSAFVCVLSLIYLVQDNLTSELY